MLSLLDARIGFEKAGPIAFEYLKLHFQSLKFKINLSDDDHVTMIYCYYLIELQMGFYPVAVVVQGAES
jgi:hypothetical protein